MQHLIHQGYQTHNITLIGHSLGGATVFYLGAKYTCKKAITMATFTSVHNIVPIIAPLMRYHPNNLAYAAQRQCPWFGIHGTTDNIIPMAHSQALLQALPAKHKKKSQRKLIQETEHNDLNKMLFEAKKFDLHNPT